MRGARDVKHATAALAQTTEETMTSTGKVKKPVRAKDVKRGPSRATKPAPAKQVAPRPAATKLVSPKMAIAKKPPPKLVKPQEMAQKPRPASGGTPRRQDGTQRPMALALPPGDLSAEMRAYLAKCQEKIGFVPNVLTSYAFDDAKLSAFAAFYNDLMLGASGLSKLEREMIAVAVSSENHCYYCLAAHGAAVRQLSGDPVLGELMAMNWRAANLSFRHKAMLAFAIKVTLHSRQVNEADRENLRKAGFSNRDIWDIAAVASFFNMSNRMASAVDMRPNPEYHHQAR
jgi:uncharacterized peroxidase-related enzyme